MRWLLVSLSVMALFFNGSNAKQFEHWYPFYRFTLTQEGDAPTCFKTYEYDLANLDASQHSMTCKNLVSCIYNNTKEIDKADMSSALVLLGLAPTVLGQMGPTISNKAQLWFRSPILGFLCVLGAPSIAFGIPWAKADPSEPPTPLNAFASGEMWFFGRIFRRHTQGSAQISLPQSIWIRLLQYSFAAGAVANIFHNVWTLADRTIVSWKCTSSYLELVWVGLTLVPISLAIVAISMERSRSTRGNTKRWALSIRSFYYLSNITVAVHVLFGTVTLSSVLFIGTLDALGVVGRLTASTLVCQLITALELERVERECEDITQSNNETKIGSATQTENWSLLERGSSVVAVEGKRAATWAN
ncbi:unnamed protein product [Penicillium glandicola]